MDPRILSLYDEYAHTPLDRRVFLDRLATLAGGTAAATALLPLLENRAVAAMVPVDDARIEATTATVPGQGGDLQAYLAQPTTGDRFGTVLVIHENRGLNAHIEDVARHLAVDGFLALAADFLSPLGGTPENEDRAREMIGQLDSAATVANAIGAVKYLRSHPRGNGKVGAVGFCWGGGKVGQLVVSDPTLDAAVVYYGQTPETVDVPRIKTSLLLHYAGLDERINSNVPAFREALDAAGVSYTLHMYDGAQHAFNNDTSVERYNADATRLAWERTVAFFNERLADNA
ncbi:MAG: dienelactone hydrolase family protein [Dongiaceae bacterium]